MIYLAQELLIYLKLKERPELLTNKRIKRLPDVYGGIFYRMADTFS